LAALPILIHLIHQQRHRTVKWAAMMFLLDAKRMHRGVARLRQILILAMRVLAVLGIIFAVSRPLASGWFGLALGGGADLSLVLLDRSASMEETDLRTGETKRETGLRKLVELLEQTRGQSRLVLIESARMDPQEIARPRALLDLPEIGPTSTHADIPTMLQRALDFIAANQGGQTEIWICSDLRKADWDPDGGRWEALREAAEGMEGLRVRLLSYPQVAPENLAVELDDVKRRERGGEAELLLDLTLRRSGESPQGETRVPLGIVVNGTRTLIDVEMTGSESKIQGQSIPLNRETKRGWGHLELPADANRQDNSAYFAFSEPPPRRSVVVSAEESAYEPMLAALRAGFDPEVDFEAWQVEPGRALEIEWDQTALVVWQAPLPTEDSVIGRQLRSFVEDGRSLLFFPPNRESGETLFSMRWGEWTTPASSDGSEETQVDWWRADSDLLRNTQGGSALPVGELSVKRLRDLVGDGNLLARLEDSTPILSRATSDRGAVYFCGVLPQESESSLAKDGVVFYVMLHRALADGASSLAPARQVPAGPGALDENEEWIRLAPEGEPIRSEAPLQAGVFQRGGKELRALNRPRAEDVVTTMTNAELKAIWEGFDMEIIRDEAGGRGSLASEIWRAFLVVMGLALLLEAILCLPQPKVLSTEGTGKA